MELLSDVPGWLWLTVYGSRGPTRRLLCNMSKVTAISRGEDSCTTLQEGDTHYFVDESVKDIEEAMKLDAARVREITTTSF